MLDHHRHQQENIIYITAGIGIIIAATLLYPGLAENLLTMSGFIPHGHCYLWKPQLVWLHVTTDTLTGLSYVAISATLAYLVHKTRQDIPFHWIFLVFGAFIVACGMTHFMEVVTLWYPMYWLSGNIKLLTALASISAALVLPPLIPQVESLLQAKKQAEEQRKQLEQANLELETLYQRVKALDQQKTKFFANVSHELRTPLTLILGPSQQLLQSDLLNSSQRHFVEVIDRNACTLLKQVNDLLTLSQLESGKLEAHYQKVDLVALLQQSAAHFQNLTQETDITLQIEAPSELVAAVDPDKMQQIYLNLLFNACKFTPSHGMIRCTLEVIEEAAIEVDSAAIAPLSAANTLDTPTSNLVQLTVEDSGPGIPQERWEHIFDRFYNDQNNARFNGTGLGLAIVKDFVELHKGSIRVDQATLGGASFTVKIPLSLPVQAKQISQSAKPQFSQIVPTTFNRFPSPASSSISQISSEETVEASVLVVEDNDEMNWFISRILSEQYRVTQAYDGQEGLKKALEIRPDLILSDVMMPVMNGVDMVQALRQHPEMQEIPVIMLTAMGDMQLRVNLLSQSVQDYLAKPFVAGELQARAANLISIKQTKQELQQALTVQGQDLAALARQLRKQTEELKRANQMKDEFLAVLSHELRTPLNPILGWAKLLQTRRFSDERTREALKTIERNAKLQTQLIDDLLDMARILRGKLSLNFAPVSLTEPIQAAVETVRLSLESNCIALQNLLDPTVGPVLGDSGRLQQVVWNLLTNAIKFTPRGGQITLQLTQQGQEAVLCISDTGKGIAPEFLPHIFEAFRQQDSSTTRQFGGLGLGLTIVRQLVELHHGSISADSSGEGKGASFTIRLPLIADPVADGPQSLLTNAVKDLHGLRVLVVDDEADSLEFLTFLLQQEGAIAIAVSSAQSALDYLRQSPVDVLLSDIGMPEMDGYELIRQVRSLPPEQGGDVVAIALTAYASDPDRDRTISAGFQKHISKPIDPEALLTTVSQLGLTLLTRQLR